MYTLDVTQRNKFNCLLEITLFCHLIPIERKIRRNPFDSAHDVFKSEQGRPTLFNYNYMTYNMLTHWQSSCLSSGIDECII